MGRLEILKNLCKERGISINKLEQELDFSQGSLGKIDSNVPKADKLYAIAQYFDVPMEMFFKDEPIHYKSSKTYSFDESETNDFIVKLSRDKDLYLLIERISKASDEDRERFIQIGRLVGLL